MKKSLYILTGCVLIAILWTSCEKDKLVEPGCANDSSITEQLSHIQGKVTHKETSKPLSGVTIECVPTGKKVQTAEDGSYIIDSLKAGMYTLKAQKEGYRDYLKSIQLTGDKNLALAIKLEEAFLEFQFTDISERPIDELKCDRPICSFKLINTGNIAGQWAIESDANWLTELSPKSGNLAAGASFQRALLEEDMETIITLKTGKKDLPLKIINKGFVIELVYIDGGKFEMGATGSYSLPDQSPVRTIRLDGYHIGKFEVTQTQWKAVMGTEPSRFKGDNLPVEQVSWEEAQEFCQKLSEATGKKYVLPTEAQWEYAARGGKKSQYYEYAGSDNVKEVAWYDHNGEDTTHPIGAKKANELGIYDMSGNVFEWCSDWYDIYDENDTDNPQGAVNGISRVYRGGSYCLGASYCRVSNRRHDYPTERSSSVGFRVAVLP